MLKDSVNSRQTHTHPDFNTHNVHVGPSHVCVSRGSTEEAGLQNRAETAEVD